MKETYRHVHLDFHTSELIPVGESFNAEEFANTLSKAKVNSITVFAKCHHGLSYYPTKIGKTHPQLKFDLLGEQVKALKKAGIRVVAYITGAWSEYDAKTHPTWIAKYPNGENIYTQNGAPNGYKPGKPTDIKPPCAWAYLCLNGEYGEYLKQTAKEVLDNYDVDGLFFDIMGLNYDCYCPTCKKGMADLGLNPENPQDARKYTVLKRQKLLKELRELVDSYNKGLSIFYNSGGADINKPEYIEYSTHYELEDLPTIGPFGYDSISNRSKYFNKFGKTVYGMTGKFHTSWGEFGGFKHPQALVQECMNMQAFNVACNIGDQMHPSGKLDKETYRLIGDAFKKVEEREKYVLNVKPASKVGLLLGSDWFVGEGYAKMLLDAHIDYNVITDEPDLSVYDIIIVCECGEISPETVDKLLKFYDGGGKLLLFGHRENAEKLYQKLGAEYLGKSEFDQDYFYCDKILNSPVLSYGGAEKYKAQGEVLAQVYEPYFSRTEEHFCSHKNTPNKLNKAEYPAVIKGDRFVICGYCAGKIYFEYGNYYTRKLFELCIDSIFNRYETFENLPVFGRYTLYERENEYVMYVFINIPIKRGEYSVLEDVVDFNNIKVNFNRKDAKSVLLFPQNKKVRAKKTKDGITFTIDKVSGNQMIIIKK